MIGLFLGVIPKIVFAAVEFAGAIIGYQMGFSIVNVVDPQSDTQVSIISSFESILTTLLFVTVNAHHLFIRIIATSYEKLPIASFLFSKGKIEVLLQLSSNVFILGLQLSAPFLILLFLANLVMGLMARSIPQLNIFIVGFPFTIGFGFILLIVGSRYFGDALLLQFNTMGHQLSALLSILNQ